MTDEPSADGGPEDGSSNRERELTYRIDADERPSVAAVRAVAALLDADPLELEPLYDVIDPDDLDGAVATEHDSSVCATVSFEFDDCEVTVTSTEVHVERSEQES